ncbi:MAG TPA: class I SAM-dependent methyltransferase [Thermoanaerobaculia bacterium]|nr:class I SAM-dependent methyltransferase [Thermoanaerobaculia bacterium]
MPASESFLYRVFRETEQLNKRAILDQLDPRPGGSLLDCGCGDGEFTAELGARAQVAEMHGIEAVEDRVRTAEGRGIRVAQADLNRRFPYDDGVFDIVHANQLIEHLQSTDGFLREIRRVVKPTGRVVLSTNNLASWHNVISLMLGMQPPPCHVSSEVVIGNRLDPLRGTLFANREDSHLRIFSFRALAELCEFHGFRTVDERTAGYYPLPGTLARLATKIDRRHGAFLIIKLAPR